MDFLPDWLLDFVGFLTSVVVAVLMTGLVVGSVYELNNLIEMMGIQTDCSLHDE